MAALILCLITYCVRAYKGPIFRKSFLLTTNQGYWNAIFLLVPRTKMDLYSQKIPRRLPLVGGAFIPYWSFVLNFSLGPQPWTDPVFGTYGLLAVRAREEIEQLFAVSSLWSPRKRTPKIMSPGAKLEPMRFFNKEWYFKYKGNVHFFSKKKY